eukprot:scaffold66937_cov45-Phaeocystis_antarctica.AAC.1
MRHFTTTCKCQLLPASSSHLTTLRRQNVKRRAPPRSPHGPDAAPHTPPTAHTPGHPHTAELCL